MSLSNVQAEAKAILSIINSASRAGLSAIVESDCQLCIDTLKAPKDRIPWKLVNFVSKALQSIGPLDLLVFS